MQPLAITLKFTKSTKGTHVYEMRNEAGVAMGSVYLPKLVVGEQAPPTLEMTVSVPKLRGTTFEEWKRLVEMVVQAKTGMSCDDLDDYRYIDDFEDRVPPRISAARAIRNAREASGF